MSAYKKIVIIAGEESGDKYAADLIRQLQKLELKLDISGIGGSHMQATGIKLIAELANLAVTGITEVLRHFKTIHQAYRAMQTYLRKTKPDLLVLIDYPGFNLRLATFAKQKLNIRILYYISPQIWAWKAKRIKTIKANVDQMTVILPFEKTLYQNAHVPVAFVGHPLVAKCAVYTQSDSKELRNRFNLPEDKRIVAMLPGSRRHEIAQHMPVLVKTMQLLNKQHHDLHFVIPMAYNVAPQLVQTYLQGQDLKVSCIIGQATAVLACSDCVVVASGTASLESALLEKPMCIIYKGSWLSYFAAMKFVKVKYLGLCNLLANQMIVPELLQHDCNAHELTRTLNELLHNKHLISRMLKSLHSVKLSLTEEKADCSLHEVVLQLL